jgi:hypothetical protein
MTAKAPECKHGLRAGCAYCNAKSKPTKTKREAIRQSAADPEMYRLRLGGQGWSGKDWWLWDHKKKRRLYVRNGAHRATAAVHDGTAKALTTDALPEQPTLGWWNKVDRHARTDAERRELVEIEALSKAFSPYEHGESGPLMAERLQPDEVAERAEARSELEAARAKARAALETRAKKAGVSKRELQLLTSYFVDNVTLAWLAPRLKVKHRMQVSRRLGEIIDRLTAGGARATALADEFKIAFGDGDLAPRLVTDEDPRSSSYFGKG